MSADSLYMWHDPTRSGLVFGIVLAFLLALTWWSVISIFAYGGLMVLCFAVALKVYVYVMNTILKKQVPDPITRYSGADFKLSCEQAEQLNEKLINVANCTIADLRKLFLIENMLDSIKFGCSLWLLTYIGNWFNALTVITLLWVGIFTIPKVYQNNKQTIDPYLEIACSKISMVRAKLEAVAPKAMNPCDEKKEE